MASDSVAKIEAAAICRARGAVEHAAEQRESMGKAGFADPLRVKDADERVRAALADLRELEATCSEAGRKLAASMPSTPPLSASAAEAQKRKRLNKPAKASALYASSAAVVAPRPGETQRDGARRLRTLGLNAAKIVQRLKAWPA